MEKFARRTSLLVLVAVFSVADAMRLMSPVPSYVKDGGDTIVRDTAFFDTLHEVTVMGDSLKLAPVKDAIRQSLGQKKEPHVKSLGEILNQVAPNTMDYILHPFGFAERKKKKKRKKVQQILQEYDRIDAPDEFTLKLDSILRLEGLK